MLHQTKHGGRDCIRKVLKPELARSVDEILRFRREFEVLKDCPHPNIIEVYDVQDASYTMEEADGNLEEYIASNDVSDAEIDRLLGQILDGLEFLHSKGIVHRDLKPSNILLIGGVAKIADLGICKPIDSSTVKTATGAVPLGTLGYMSLAQQNAPNNPTFHFDIFALGRVIYYMETRNHPPIGPLPRVETRYRVLVQGTEAENPVKVPDVAAFRSLLAALRSPPASLEKAVDEFLVNGGSVDRILQTIAGESGRDRFEFLDSKFREVIARLGLSDVVSIDCFVDAYLGEFRKYQKKKYWPFSKLDAVTSHLLWVHSSVSDPALKEQLLVRAFKTSFGSNQFKSQDMFCEVAAGLTAVERSALYLVLRLNGYDDDSIAALRDRIE